MWPKIKGWWKEHGDLLVWHILRIELWLILIASVVTFVLCIHDAYHNYKNTGEIITVEHWQTEQLLKIEVRINKDNFDKIGRKIE